MAENADGQEKSEEPTEKRLRKARQDGDIARSKELVTFLMVVAAALYAFLLGAQFMAELRGISTAGLSLERDHAYDVHKMLDHILGQVVAAMYMVLPFFLLMVFIAIVGSSLLGGFNFSTKAMSFKFSKLNPVSGIKRMFSTHALMELFKALAKFSLVLTAAIAFLWYAYEQVIALGTQDINTALASAGRLIVEAFLVASLALIVVVVVDVPFQVYQHTSKLKMTKQEVKEEFKQQEGNPEVKGRIRRIQMEMAQKRMMQKVPQADVVITNPTHYSVALQYDPDTMRAPVVLASGTDFVASQIRTIAQQHNIPIVEAPPLARSLYYNAEIDQPIPEPLFKAVAAVLAYVFGLRDNKSTKPLDVNKLEIPDDFKADA